MQLATNTLESLLTASAAIVNAPQRAAKKTAKLWQRLDRILQRHDRKGKLRAGLLGITPQKFRELQKKQSFEQLVRQFGFIDIRSFCTAVLGKVKDQLRSKGWSQNRIDHYIGRRSGRLFTA